MEELIDLSKQANHISTPNHLMADYEIKITIRWLGQCICISPDMEPLHDPNSLSLMLMLALMVFPDYYFRYELYLNLIN